MQFQLPPRRVWINWCGGFSVLDFILMSLVVSMNLMWFIKGMQDFNTRYDARACDEWAGDSGVDDGGCMTATGRKQSHLVCHCLVAR